MKKLLNTLFVTTEDAYLSLENENVVIRWGEDNRKQYPLLILESILCFSYAGASPALMGACAKHGIGLSFFTPNGKFLARSTGWEHGNVLLRKTQYRISDSVTDSCAIARHFIFGKIHNAKWLIERTLRDHALRVDANHLKEVSQKMSDGLQDVLKQDKLEQLRGIEGMYASVYFSVFHELILNQKEDFPFSSRNRRPPMDRVNALLSFLYTLLNHDCASAAEAVGLDAYVGFLHRDRPGRTSLALDLMEELRPVLADRFALTLINTKAIRSSHFKCYEDGAVLLNDEGRKIVLSAWQARKREELTHPYLKEKMTWGLVPYIQALLLARCLRGDLDAYPPFLWK